MAQCSRRRTPRGFYTEAQGQRAARHPGLGRKVYFGAVVTLVSVLRHGVSPPRLSRLRELVGVSARTVRRWRQWWLENFAVSAFWRGGRGHLRLPVDDSRLPLSLLEAFEAHYKARAAQDPLGVLRRKRRRDSGCLRAWSDGLRQVLEAQYESHRSWSYQLHADNLKVEVEESPELGTMPSYATVRRYMKRAGMIKERRRRLERRDPRKSTPPILSPGVASPVYNPFRVEIRRTRNPGWRAAR